LGTEGGVGRINERYAAVAHVPRHCVDHSDGIVRMVFVYRPQNLIVAQSAQRSLERRAALDRIEVGRRQSVRFGGVIGGRRGRVDIASSSLAAASAARGPTVDAAALAGAIMSSIRPLQHRLARPLGIDASHLRSAAVTPLVLADAGT
jgi:hypothetical protein